MNLEKIRSELLTRQDEIEARLERTHRHLYRKDEPVSPNFSEQAKERENEDLVRTLDEGGQRELGRIRHALERLESGDYPYCARCGGPIGERRLDAIPYTDKCIRCASLEE